MAAPLSILPDPKQLHLIHLAATAQEITAVVETITASVSCPLCGRMSGPVNARYIRSVADLP